jgi:peptide-methionine (S)-S-oxide reductase
MGTKTWLAVIVGLVLALCGAVYIAGGRATHRAPALIGPPPVVGGVERADLGRGGSAMSRTPVVAEPPPLAAGLERATFGNGCFWCTEAVFQRLKGVQSVVSGYSGGWAPNPTYQEVCTGATGHAEALQITYDPAIVSYRDLLEVFWQTHDPTTMNRQGADVGTQYRSAIFYHSDKQKELAEELKRKLDASGAFDGPIVTEVTPFTAFYPAEDYHQNYYNQHPGASYCRANIAPKLEKLKKVFHDKLNFEKSE